MEVLGILRTGGRCSRRIRKWNALYDRHQIIEKSAICGASISALAHLQSRIADQFANGFNPFESVLCLTLLKNLDLMFACSDRSSCRKLIGIPEITNMGRGRPA